MAVGECAGSLCGHERAAGVQLAQGIDDKAMTATSCSFRPAKLNTDGTEGTGGTGAAAQAGTAVVCVLAGIVIDMGFPFQRDSAHRGQPARGSVGHNPT